MHMSREDYGATCPVLPNLARAGGGRLVLVTGGAGFLGSHLCARLLADGEVVVCADDFSTGREDNVRRLEGSGNFHLLRHDVTEKMPDDLPAFDEIYNLACPASPPHYQADPVKTALTSALGARNVLERAGRDGARLFHASTSEVYGDPEMHPQSEAYWGHVNPIGPRACYDEGKRFAEMLMVEYGRQNGVAVRMARIFNTYGPNMRPDDGRVVSNFIIQALSGADLTLYGDGSQTRSFCYVDDLIEGFVRLMRAEGPIEGPVNLGNPAEFTVAELARTVLRLVGGRSRLVNRPLPEDDPRQRRPDITRAEQWLGWYPQVPLENGLRRTISYFDRLLRQDMPATHSGGQPVAV